MSVPRVVLLTGRSDPARTGLPAAQMAFLAAVTPPGAVALLDGYPWTGGAPERPVPLALAAWRNARHWRAARSGAARAAVSAHLRALGEGRRALITGSCGLDLLSCGWSPGLCELVVALGPVTPHRPRWPGTRVITIAGRRDGLSRMVHRDAPDFRVPCGHMGYWACPGTRRAVAGILRDWAP